MATLEALARLEVQSVDWPHHEEVIQGLLQFESWSFSLSGTHTKERIFLLLPSHPPLKHRLSSNTLQAFLFVAILQSISSPYHLLFVPNLLRLLIVLPIFSHPASFCVGQRVLILITAGLQRGDRTV